MPGFARRQLLTATLVAGLSAPLCAQEREQLVEGARKEGQLALAHSVSLASFPRFMQAFEAKYPFIQTAPGLYGAPTGRVLARVEGEIRARALSFDVLHVASLAPFLGLSRQGLLADYQSPELAAYPPEAHDRGQWATARIVGVIMAYNRNVLRADLVPKSWADLLRPEFKDRKLIIQDAAAGTCFNQMYMLGKTLGQGFLERLGAQRPIVVATAAQLIDMLVRGEAIVGATVDHYRAFEPDPVKAGIVGVYPTEGMPLAAAPIAIFNDAPHPKAARLFEDFVLSAEGQELLNTQIFQTYSMRTGFRPPPGQLPLAETKPMIPTDLRDYEQAAQHFPETFDDLFKA
ncbi:MAG: extracellular solute-binding protein [Acetobacteraceae bacterium]|nr:extracellular solute-binding protein [Acetobacteraceae bacterium]